MTRNEKINLLKDIQRGKADPKTIFNFLESLETFLNNRRPGYGITK